MKFTGSRTFKHIGGDILAEDLTSEGKLSARVLTQTEAHHLRCWLLGAATEQSDDDARGFLEHSAAQLLSALTARSEWVRASQGIAA